jgi:hypothetical protein
MQRIRSFPSRVELCHNLWLAEAFDLGVNDRGIDLADKDLGIELKCRYDKWKTAGYAVHSYQVRDFEEQNPGKNLFWAFVLYALSKQPKDIGMKEDVDKCITKKEAWFLPWDWIKQFPVSCPKTGPYIYVSRKKLPDQAEFSTFRKEGGTLYVHKDCPELVERLL